MVLCTKSSTAVSRHSTSTALQRPDSVGSLLLYILWSPMREAVHSLLLYIWQKANSDCSLLR